MKLILLKRASYTLNIKLLCLMLIVLSNAFGQNERLKPEFRLKGSEVTFYGMNRKTVSYLEETFALTSNNTQMLKLAFDRKIGPAYVSSSYDFLLINYFSPNQQLEGRFQSFGMSVGPCIDVKRFRFDFGLNFKAIYGNINFKNSTSMYGLNINTNIQNASYVKLKPSLMYGLQSHVYYELRFKHKFFKNLNLVKPMINLNVEYSILNPGETGEIDGNRLLDNYFNTGFGISFLIRGSSSGYPVFP